MRKLSEYVEMAALEYWQESGKDEVSSVWIAEFFQDSGVLDNYPNQDLVAFQALVQKTLTVSIERANKLERMKQDEFSRSSKR